LSTIVISSFREVASALHVQPGRRNKLSSSQAVY
jgi:hypothetical protein